MLLWYKCGICKYACDNDLKYHNCDDVLNLCGKDEIIDVKVEPLETESCLEVKQNENDRNEETMVFLETDIEIKEEPI